MSGRFDPRDPMLEIVDGTIIGEFTHPYQFWTRDGKRRIAQGHFQNDGEAETWFKAKHPNDYKVGVEMRCYDVS